MAVAVVVAAVAVVVVVGAVFGARRKCPSHRPGFCALDTLATAGDAGTTTYFHPHALDLDLLGLLDLVG